MHKHSKIDCISLDQYIQLGSIKYLIQRLIIISGLVLSYRLQIRCQREKPPPPRTVIFRAVAIATRQATRLCSTPRPRLLPPSYSQLQSHSRALLNENLNFGASEMQRVREFDAGPVPRHLQYEDDTETLPPEYGQLLSSRLSGRAGQVWQQQPPRSPFNRGIIVIWRHSSNVN
jgi:hypothetical protein